MVAEYVEDNAETTVGTPTASDSTSSSGFSVSPNAIGTLTSTLMGFVETGVPGASSAAGKTASGIAAGKAPEDIALDAVSSIGKAATTKELTSLGFPAAAIGYGIATAGNVASEMSAANPNMGYAMTKAAPAAAGAVAGMMALGPLGAMVGGVLGGMLGKSSMESGMLGDAVDARDHEGFLDEYEDMGFSREESASIRDTESDMVGQYDPTGRDHFEMSSETLDAWGAANDAQALENEAQGDDMGDEEGDSTGAGGDGGVGGSQDSGDHY